MNNDSQFFTGLNYEVLVESSLRMVVRSALCIAEKSGLPGNTHFFISFSTNFPGVTLDEELIKKHPEVMTIVVQHQFEDLVVEEKDFSITLYFSGKPTRITVPFESVTAFNDPSARFSLQFDSGEDEEADSAPVSMEPASPSGRMEEARIGEVVQLDAFRKQPS